MIGKQPLYGGSILSWSFGLDKSVALTLRVSRLPHAEREGYTFVRPFLARRLSSQEGLQKRAP